MKTLSFENNELIKAVFFILLAFISMFLVLIIFFYYSRKKIVQQELGKKDLEIKHQKKLLQTVLFTQEEERKRIAQDLHDDISSKLNVVSLNSHLLKTPNLSEEEHAEITDNIIKLTTNALENSRRIAHDLLPPVLEKFGLNSGIEELVTEFNSTKVVQVTYHNTISFKEYDFNFQLHFFRILQELLNNAVRHGKAANISININKIESNNVCIVTDDGIGFEVKKNDIKKGLGMQNIESRVDFFNGTIEYKSANGNGTTVTINF
jgi:two-component system, NarL family, sensor kinase